MTAPLIGTIYLEDLEVGLSREIGKTITEQVINAFAELSEDRNPLHLDEAYAKSTLFGTRIAHGMLGAALFSGVIGEQLPGHGTVYLAQDLKFLAPVLLGEHVIARVTVAEIHTEKRRVVLDCEAMVGEKTVIKGKATVLAPSRAA